MPTMILNLTGLRAAAAPAPAPAPAPTNTQQLFGRPPNPPAPAPRTVSLNLAGLRAINAAAPATGQTYQQLPAASGASHAGILATSVVHLANGTSPASAPDSVQSAASNAASQASAQVAAAQAAGQDTVSLAVDTTTGNVTLANLEAKVKALPMPVKLGLGLLAVLGIGKLVHK